MESPEDFAARLETMDIVALVKQVKENLDFLLNRTRSNIRRAAIIESKIVEFNKLRNGDK